MHGKSPILLVPFGTCICASFFFDFSCFIQNQYSYMFLLIGAFKINLSYL